MAQLCGQQVTEVEIVGDEEHSGSVRSLRFAEEHTSKLDPETPVAHISFVHAEEAEGEEVEGEGEGLEPEVITEAKDKDAEETSAED